MGVLAGDERQVEITFPDDYPAEQLAGKDAEFDVEVKEVKEKRLPELDDDFAVEAGGYDSLDELRADIEERLREADERAIEREFREAAVDAAVERSEVDIPHDLVHAKAHEMWDGTARRLSRRASTPRLPPAHRQDRGGAGHRGRARGRAGARGARPCLRPIVEAEGIEVSDDEVVETPCARPPAPQARARSSSSGRSSARARRARRAAARGHRDAEGRGPPGGARQADPARHGGGAREALDAREGAEKGSGEIWTPGS